ncbi:hypothetical protein AB0A63_36630 [Lentzea sp. NPDC042327]|uniref:hypothetical protein n=1 Tax=Lentzea sp. NPDC042327 TaxID=3154801 RepID=UPI0033F4284E
MIRRMLLVAATALGVVLVPTGQAQAIPMCKSGYACLYQYWADSEHTVFNGFRSIDCQGRVDSSGKLSGYLQFTQARCNDV